jgi:hypothetical protein
MSDNDNLVDDYSMMLFLTHGEFIIDCPCQHKKVKIFQRCLKCPERKICKQDEIRIKRNSVICLYIRYHKKAPIDFRIHN